MLLNQQYMTENITYINIQTKNEYPNKINLLNHSQYIKEYINETGILLFSLNESFDSNIHLDASTCSGK